MIDADLRERCTSVTGAQPSGSAEFHMPLVVASLICCGGQRGAGVAFAEFRLHSDAVRFSVISVNALEAL